jgi:DNA end-binding protein Ku
MSAHAIGSATISFGLVSVPIQMYSSGEASAAISFNWLHKKCGTRLKQQYVCPKDEEVVEKDEMIKGYEFSKGRYVTFTPDEVKALGEKGTGSIDVREFVTADQVDRRYVDRTYFLGPDKGGEKAFRLLAEALKKTQRVAIGQYAARGKQYLILLRPFEDGLAMEQLKYANEVRTIADVPIPKVELKKAEIDLAIQVVEQGKVDVFRPEAYEDNVRKRALEQIERKVEGEEITEEPEEAPKTQILDLMEALKASVKSGKAADERKAAKAERPAKKQLKRKVS